MPPPTLLPSKATDANEPGSSLYTRRTCESTNLSFVGSWPSESNATMVDRPSNRRPLRQLLSVVGRRIEAVVDRTVARAGLDFEGIARRLLMKLRAPHSRCRAWPEFAGTPVVELAIELGSGRCTGCNQKYMGVLGGSNNHEVKELLLRLVPSVEYANC
jgi:hypothetical protein